MDGDVTAPAREHLNALAAALVDLEAQLERIARWGQVLTRLLLGGGRLLVAGNGGSAAEAQHLTAELVGRYCEDRRPFSALALHAETSSLTAIVNDYGADDMFARQVRAHGRPGDLFIALSTSGNSRNVIAAARTASMSGMTTWGLTGPAPNVVASCCDDSINVDSPTTATVQEAHLVLIHLLCAQVDANLARADLLSTEKVNSAITLPVGLAETTMLPPSLERMQRGTTDVRG